MKHAHALAAVLLLGAAAGRASAQKLSYDAGVAGAPPVAPNPATQGWTEILKGATTVGDVSPDPDWGVNAWQVTDPGDGCATYFHEVFAHMFEVGFELTADIRPLAGSTTHMGISTGTILTDSYWSASLSIQGTDVIVQDGPGNTIVCAGGADGAYHTYAMRNPTGQYPSDLELYYDGAHVGKQSNLHGNQGVPVFDRWYQSNEGRAAGSVGPSVRWPKPAFPSN